MTEIRSFRRVFDLERRIYSVERLRLNPSGVPVRGVVYLLVAVAGSMLVSAWPITGPLAGTVPWYLRELAAPAALATVLAVVRVDGRTFHHAARAHLRLLSTPRHVLGLRGSSALGQRWRPAAVVFLPDGSDDRLRALTYEGPGAVLVAAPHRRAGAAERRGVAVSRRRTVWIYPAREHRGPRSAQVITIERGTRLVVVAGGAPR